MKTTPISVVATRITDIPALDPVTVFWMDYGDGKGALVIECFGAAWATYFGAMGQGKTIRQFFAQCDVDYLRTKLGITPYLKETRKHKVYLERIIRAVQQSLVEEVAAQGGAQ